MNEIIFLIGSLPLIYFSRYSLLSIRRHGFYRFWGWEAILWLLVNNVRMWFLDPFTVVHLVSWILLTVSLVLAVVGIIVLAQRGRRDPSRQDNALYKF
jgi:hypothetical protein